jgi:Flp pilus assembly protein TadB
MSGANCVDGKTYNSRYRTMSLARKSRKAIWASAQRYYEVLLQIDAPDAGGKMDEPVRRSARRTVEALRQTSTVVMTNGTAIVLAYVLVSIGVIVAFVGAVFMVEWFIGWRRERRRGQRGEE